MQIKNDLLEEIQSGALLPDDRIPSEHKLAKKYSVSRLTVQRAIRELVSEGLLRRAQGSGTFVNKFTHRFSLVEVRDVGEEIARLGGNASSEVLLQRRYTPPPEIDELLELDPGQEVFHVAVLQSMDGVPVAHEERFAVVDVYPDLLDQDFSKRSVFDYLAARSILEDIENIVSAVHVDIPHLAAEAAPPVTAPQSPTAPNSPARPADNPSVTQQPQVAANFDSAAKDSLTAEEILTDLGKESMPSSVQTNPTASPTSIPANSSPTKTTAAPQPQTDVHDQKELMRRAANMRPVDIVRSVEDEADTEASASASALPSENPFLKHL